MFKKCRFRRHFDKQHGKRFETLLKYARQHFYRVYWLLWRKLCWKKPLLAIFKILGLFVNTLTADGKSSVLNRDDVTQPLQIQFSNKQKSLLNFFVHPSNIDLNFNILRTIMTITAYIFPKLQIAKDVVR